MSFKNLKLFILFFTFTLFFTFSSMASAEGISSKYYTYLLKDNIKINKIQSLIKKNGLESDVTIIDEINLLNVKSSSKNINQVANFKNEIKNDIEVQGSMSQVVYMRKKFSNKLDYNLDKKINHNLKISSNYFKPYNNYLSETTNNYESYKYSKGKGVNIALIDTGVDIEHPNLRKNIDLHRAKNYVTTEPKNVTDNSGHGTGVAGIIQTLAPDAKIIPYKVADESGGESLWIIEAIIDAVNDKNNVINLSLGTYLSQNENDKILLESYERAINYAVERNVIIVASSGNDGLNLEDYEKYGYTHVPGGNKNVITVSSNTNNNELAPYSNYGHEVDYSATGGSSYNLDYIDTPEDLIVTTSPIHKEQSLIEQSKKMPIGYTLTEGTSFAAPQVSAAVALIISQQEKEKKYRITSKEVNSILEEGSIDIGDKGKDIFFGNGKVNIYKSVHRN
ncbi:S8 family serine peptidase (plasmid) [Priestia megaterium]|uniref:S8 family peptidase n=1 Tax=Priestia megaterium TaxID=1404 RepID=UPI001EDB7E0C|nr:S8 family serine peptidase [Priestia megaterium]UKJ83498.1 S8 family serine peptidase [Priestia megaterium]